MSVIARRGFLAGIGAMLAAPAIVHAGNLMPVKALTYPRSGMQKISMKLLTDYQVQSDQPIDRLDILFGSFVPAIGWQALCELHV